MFEIKILCVYEQRCHQRKDMRDKAKNEKKNVIINNNAHLNAVALLGCWVKKERENNNNSESLRVQ